VIDQVAQSERQPLGVERNPFTHGERCRLMIQAKRKQLHDRVAAKAKKITRQAAPPWLREAARAPSLLTACPAAG
jgi:hypothetical protein